MVDKIETIATTIKTSMSVKPLEGCRAGAMIGVPLGKRPDAMAHDGSIPPFVGQSRRASEPISWSVAKSVSLLSQYLFLFQNEFRVSFFNVQAGGRLLIGHARVGRGVYISGRNRLRYLRLWIDCRSEVRIGSARLQA